MRLVLDSPRSQRQRGRWKACWAIPAILVGVLGSANAAATAGSADEETVLVPGGTASVARLLGTVDETPERFLVSLNQLLLTYNYEGDRWEDNDLRVRLVHYLNDLERLESEFSSSFELALEPKAARKTVRRLCEFLGYEAKMKQGKLTLIPGSDESASRRQRLANALGWDLPGVAEALNDGERPRLEVVADQVPASLPLRHWEEALGREIPRPAALKVLARNQRLGLLLDGSRRLSADTRRAMDQIGWHWLHDNAAPQLFRYAASIRVADGELQLPGGSGTADAWTGLLKKPLAPGGEFLEELLTKKEGRAAFLWQSLAWAPQRTVEFYLGGAATTRPERKLVRKLFGRLDETTRADFDQPRGGDLGFGTFVRSIPLADDGKGFALPGGLGLWFIAIRDDEAPSTDEGLARLVRKGLQRRLAEDEFLLRSLNERVEVRGVKRPVLPRLIRTSRSFAAQPSLLTPENVILLARASDNYPAVLGILDELALTRPEVIQHYLLAAAHLDRLEISPETELLLLSFQGGIEWLRALARAGKVESAVLEDHLDRWSLVHRRHDEPFAAAPEQLAWISSLLGSLPDPPVDAPGRGPLERAFLDALVETRDPQSFEWNGLAYRGRRGGQLALRLAEHLERQEIPTADDLHAIHLSFGRLERAVSGGDVEAASEAIVELRRLLGRMGGADLAAGLTDKHLRPRLLPIDRQRLDGMLEKIAKARKPKKLARQLGDVVAARQLLARELRPFLLSPAYLLAMGETKSVLLEDPNLIRKHLFAEDDPWRGAKVMRVEGSELGAHVSGHLGSLAEALAGYSLIADDGGGAQHPYRNAFYQEFVNTRWADLTVDVNRMIAAASAVGRQVQAEALEQLEGGGQALEFVAARVPLARFERDGGRLSPSELVMIGLAALAGDEADEAGLRYLDGASRAPFDRSRAALGGDWRSRLHRAGAATPHLNGRSAPWIGTWPPYEAVEIESRPEALYERLVLDLELTVLDYLGRKALPGVVGRDLMATVLPDASSQPQLTNWRDWEGFLRWLARVDDDYLDNKLRQCMRQGLYIADF